MGHVEKLERRSDEMKEAIAVFERDAKNKGMDITREVNSPVGYWYQNAETNTAFFWFLSGKSYADCIGGEMTMNDLLIGASIASNVWLVVIVGILWARRKNG